VPRRIRGELPAWAWDWLRTGKEPGEHDPGYDQWFGFAFCGEEVAGLGRLLTEEDAARVAQLKRQARRADQA
jgi:hypothetical protein